MTADLTLFGQPARQDRFTPPTDAGTPPTCPQCRIRPIRWGPVTGDWSRYCNGNHCGYPFKRCVKCGQDVAKADFRFVKFCSIECRNAAGNSSRPFPDCSLCGKPLPTHNPRIYQTAPACADCLAPIQHVLQRLRDHHVPAPFVERLIQDPACPLCGTDLLVPVLQRTGSYVAPLVIDHDHDCCPGAHSCGQCIRGLICTFCNRLLGLARNNPATLHAAGEYLEKYEAGLALR